MKDTLGMLRNRNPGNVKKPSNDEWKGTIVYDKYGHAIFSDMSHGVRALWKNFTNRQKKCPNMTLLEYFSKIYAEENGDKEAEYIANQQNISVDTPLKDVDIDKMVIAVAWFESNIEINQDHIDSCKKRFNLTPNNLKESFKGSDKDEMVIFKVRDYTTKLLGRRRMGEIEMIYYVERGDGTCYTYDGYRIEWSEKLSIGV